MSTELPYDFDLHYDIKHMFEVEMIANGEPTHSRATPSDLVELFQLCGLPVPECLTKYKVIYIHTDNTWSHEPREGSVRVEKA